MVWVLLVQDRNGLKLVLTRSESQKLWFCVRAYIALLAFTGGLRRLLMIQYIVARFMVICIPTDKDSGTKYHSSFNPIQSIMNT